jgi:hypothetical protein
MAAVAVVLALVIVPVLVIAAAVGGARDQSALLTRVQTTVAPCATEGAMNMAIRECIELTDDDSEGVHGGIAAGASVGPDVVVQRGRQGLGPPGQTRGRHGTLAGGGPG